MKTMQPVMPLNALWIGELQACELNGQAILLARLDDGVFACRDRCPHQGYPLSYGKMEHGVLRCALHHWEFDLASGRGINPACTRLHRLPVEIRDDQIFVALEDDRDVA